MKKKTKQHSKNVKAAPAKKQDEIFDCLKEKGVILGDIVSPALTKEEWGNLWPEDDD